MNGALNVIENNDSSLAAILRVLFGRNIPEQGQCRVGRSKPGRLRQGDHLGEYRIHKRAPPAAATADTAVAVRTASVGEI
jgi:hypothetical protein